MFLKLGNVCYQSVQESHLQFTDRQKKTESIILPVIWIIEILISHFMGTRTLTAYDTGGQLHQLRGLHFKRQQPARAMYSMIKFTKSKYHSV